MASNIRLHPYPGSAEECQLCQSAQMTGTEEPHFERTLVVSSFRPIEEVATALSEAISVVLQEIDETWYWKS